MDADLDVVFSAVEEIWVSAGQTPIARITAGFPAVVRIPIVRGVVFSHDVIKPVTVVIFINIDLSSANRLFVEFDIF